MARFIRTNAKSTRCSIWWKRKLSVLIRAFLNRRVATETFLAEILRRKLRVVSTRYARSQLEWERNAITALSSVYGIDILQDNAIACRQRLFGIWDDEYSQRFKARRPTKCAARQRAFLLEKNIVWGDALTFRTVDDHPRPIVLSEWALVSGSQMKRRDYHVFVFGRKNSSILAVQRSRRSRFYFRTGARISLNSLFGDCPC